MKTPISLCIHAACASPQTFSVCRHIPQYTLTVGEVNECDLRLVSIFAYRLCLLPVSYVYFRGLTPDEHFFVQFRKLIALIFLISAKVLIVAVKRKPYISILPESTCTGYIHVQNDLGQSESTRKWHWLYMYYRNTVYTFIIYAHIWPTDSPHAPTPLPLIKKGDEYLRLHIHKIYIYFLSKKGLMK